MEKVRNNVAEKEEQWVGKDSERLTEWWNDLKVNEVLERIDESWSETGVDSAPDHSEIV